MRRKLSPEFFVKCLNQTLVYDTIRHLSSMCGRKECMQQFLPKSLFVALLFQGQEAASVCRQSSRRGRTSGGILGVVLRMRQRGRRSNNSNKRQEEERKRKYKGLAHIPEANPHYPVWARPFRECMESWDGGWLPGLRSFQPSNCWKGERLGRKEREQEPKSKYPLHFYSFF
jgi:hypothetical protein